MRKTQAKAKTGRKIFAKRANKTPHTGAKNDAAEKRNLKVHADAQKIRDSGVGQVAGSPGQAAREKAMQDNHVN